MEIDKNMQTKTDGVAKARPFVREVNALNAALIIQFLLGMYINI